MKCLEIKAGEKQSEIEVLGNKQLSTIYLPPIERLGGLNASSVESPAFTILTGHDLEKKHLGVLYKDGKSFTFTPTDEYTVHILNPSDFEGAQTLAFQLNKPLKKDYKIWLYLHTF